MAQHELCSEIGAWRYATPPAQAVNVNATAAQPSAFGKVSKSITQLYASDEAILSIIQTRNERRKQGVCLWVYWSLESGCGRALEWLRAEYEEGDDEVDGGGDEVDDGGGSDDEDMDVDPENEEVGGRWGRNDWCRDGRFPRKRRERRSCA